MDKNLTKENRDKVKFSLLTLFCNATQIYRRTIPKEKKEKYCREVKEIIKHLIEKSDNNSLRNEDIRSSIKELSVNAEISIGASQKAINVYLKYYCIVSNKNEDVLKELDCPIDSKVIAKNKLERINLKDLNLKYYEQMQEALKKKHGIRILADIEAYDSEKEY